MTTTSQTLILDRITTAIEANEGITLINDRQYANTGTLRTLDADLNQIAAVEYEFNDGYCNFGKMSRRVASLWYGMTDTTGKAAWVTGNIPDLVAAVTEHLLPTTERNP